LNVSIVAQDGDRRESGNYGFGGRYLYDKLFEDHEWEHAIDEALAQALTNLRSVAAPAGEMTVLLGPGWPGVLLHEAVGHGLEGDFNRKGSSVFSGKIGQRVAAPGVTVVDDGTMLNRRGSLSIDDEGTPTQENVLIEDGILRAYMQDRMNARLMGVEPTGNGRRESYAHAPMPRMTNTFMRGGNDDPAELLSRVKNGIFAKSFDDISIIPTFVLTPLIYLGGIFYSIKMLPPFWQDVSLLNPILYMINAFRYGILGVSDIDIHLAFAIVILFVAALFGYSLWLLRRGTGIRT
jgi:predicted Zn-dependent protease